MSEWSVWGREERVENAFLHRVSAFLKRRNLRIVKWLDIDE